MTPTEEAAWNRKAAIEEAITDAIDDDEGRLTVGSLEHHLVRNGIILLGPIEKDDFENMRQLVDFARKIRDKPLAVKVLKALMIAVDE